MWRRRRVGVRKGGGVNRRGGGGRIFSLLFSTEEEDESSSGGAPPPIQVLLTTSSSSSDGGGGGGGRGVFATTRIEAGQLIHTAKPILSHPYYSFTPPSSSSSTVLTTPSCYLCLKKLPPPCSNTFNNTYFFRSLVNNINQSSPSPSLSPSFCSPRCELHSFQGFYEVEKQADWSSHTHHCCTQGLRYPFLAKRLACMVVSGVATADALDILQPAILSTPMISQMEKEFTLLRKALEEADVPNEKISFLTKQWYIGVLARIRINAFRIELVGTSYEDLLSLAAASVEVEAAVGNALYMLPSFYNHDCDPNAHIVWTDSVDARVKALRDIDEGEELRICYIDASMDYDARQRILYEGFGFKCSCLRCQSGD